VPDEMPCAVRIAVGLTAVVVPPMVPLCVGLDWFPPTQYRARCPASPEGPDFC